MSESKLEEIISVLWAILLALCYIAEAPDFLIKFLWVKVIWDTACVFYYGLKEIRKEAA